jgi:hypothetical protein
MNSGFDTALKRRSTGKCVFQNLLPAEALYGLSSKRIDSFTTH